jgi:hypothetical protein
MSDEVRYGDGTVRPANATSPANAKLPPLPKEAAREEFRSGLGAGQGYSSRGYGGRELDRTKALDPLRERREAMPIEVKRRRRIAPWLIGAGVVLAVIGVIAAQLQLDA